MSDCIQEFEVLFCFAQGVWRVIVVGRRPTESSSVRTGKDATDRFMCDESVTHRRSGMAFSHDRIRTPFSLRSALETVEAPPMAIRVRCAWPSLTPHRIFSTDSSHKA